MTVCACPQGLILRDYEYHQEVAQRFLESLNTTRITATPITGTFGRGGLTTKEASR